MSEILWKLPVPATALLRSPVFATLAKRQCALSFEVEADEGDGETHGRLLFDGVEAYKCTYLTSCTAEMFNTAYGKVVNLGSTPWLQDVLQVYSKSSPTPKPLQHLMICFDDGPCYEFICASVEPSSAPAKGHENRRGAE
jgi:hypothetical protein